MLWYYVLVLTFTGASVAKHFAGLLFAAWVYHRDPTQAAPVIKAVGDAFPMKRFRWRWRT